MLLYLSEFVSKVYRILVDPVEGICRGYVTDPEHLGITFKVSHEIASQFALTIWDQLVQATFTSQA